ncbi:MAG TPA: zf-HC2 domain-containing protein [Gemmatimonadaceae bacterium]|nr:zf-HC2 domain-containing protein [Gemmatimonadaceae bacterium]
MNLLHPTQPDLNRFAHGELHDTRRTRVAVHLEKCQRCRGDVAFVRDLSATAIKLDRPQPSDDLRRRIILDRAAGERVILPTYSASPGAFSSVHLMAAAAACLMVLGLGLTLAWERRTGEPKLGLETREAAPAEAPSNLRDLLASTVFFPTTAEAREPAAHLIPMEPVGPKIDGTRMISRVAGYERRYLTARGERVVGGSGQVRVVPGKTTSGEVWLFDRKWSEVSDTIPSSRRQVETESLVLARKSLRIIERSEQVLPYRKYDRINITQSFRGDTITGRMTTTGADSRGVGRPIKRILPASAGPFITDGFAPLFFTAVRVDQAWHGRVSIVGWAVRDNDVYFPIELRVVGGQSMTVPAGTFDCWHFVITSGTKRIDFWARKSDGLAVLTRDESRKSTRGVSEIVLVSDTRL